MSTSKRKMIARQLKHAEQKEHRRYEKLFTPKIAKKEFVEYKPLQRYLRETPNIPSIDAGTQSSVCALTEKKTYTGTLVKGISTLHKSNAVPIINQEEAIEHAHMRR